MKRRKFLALASATAGYAAAASALQHVRGAATLPPGAREKAETVLRIQPMTLELAPGVNIKTVGYNGHAPGPVLRFKEGAQVNIDVYNETNVADLVHWHGLAIDPINDGAMEEGSPHDSRRGASSLLLSTQAKWHTLVSHPQHCQHRSDTGNLFGPVWLFLH